MLIEDKTSGTPLIQDLRRGSWVRPIAVTPKLEKAARMSLVSRKIEAGQVHLPERAPWLGEFVTELLAFPDGAHDDQVDSLSQFLTWFDERDFRISAAASSGTADGSRSERLRLRAAPAAWLFRPRPGAAKRAPVGAARSASPAPAAKPGRRQPANAGSSEAV